MNTNTMIAGFGALVLVSLGVWFALKERLRIYRVESKWVRQPIPEATKEDVERIGRRDFPDVPFEDVFTVLKEFENARWESVTYRIRVDALKLANGSLEDLKKQIAWANQDYRDVIVAAEYPGYWKAQNSFRNFHKEVSKKERQRIVDADWQQYQDWLRK